MRGEVRRVQRDTQALQRRLRGRLQLRDLSGARLRLLHHLPRVLETLGAVVLQRQHVTDARGHLGLAARRGGLHRGARIARNVLLRLLQLLAQRRGEALAARLRR